MRSIAYLGVSALNQSLLLFTLNWFIDVIIVTAVSEFKDRISYFGGFPVKEITLSS